MRRALTSDQEQILSELGWVRSVTGGQHYKYLPPTPGQSIVYVPKTPSDHRSMLNVLSEFRRQGVELSPQRRNSAVQAARNTKSKGARSR